ncbi:MAG: FimV family protein [Gammaproteobacteria bacterium]|nr:FimV family protein [Gammaproteobacteria bacterium]
MVRKLSLMLVLTLALVPLAAQALGLGDIRPNSALNQAFNAEIKLLSVSKGEIHDVRVSMASDEAYKRSGVERTFLLSKLRFSPEIKADGAAIIRVTSSDPIREPFLNFLIEVNWPKGRLVREYTVLLDPPVTLERKPAPIQAPAVTKTRVVAPKTSVESAKPVVAAPKTLTQSVHPAYAGALDEVKVKKNASLWVIARKHKYSGIDQHRMMMAIYHANPRAFIKNNINRLKQGAILRIPNKEDILALEKREAQTEYKQHVDAWHADTEIVRADPGPAPVQQPAPEPMTPDSEHEQAAVEQEAEASTEESAAETETKTAEESAPEVDGKLKIATARPEGEGEAGPSEDSEADQTISRLKQELLIVEEDAESARSEGDELASRVDDLEDQLDDVERLLELKSEQLANMQAALAKSQEEQGLLEQSNEQLKGELAQSQEQVVAEPAREESATEIVVEETEPEPVVEETEPEPVVEETEPEPVVEEAKPEPVVEEAKPEPVVEEAKPEPVVEEAKPEPVVEEAKPEPVVEEAKPESVIKPIAETASAESKPAPAVQKPAQEPGLLDEIMSNPTMLGIVVGVIIILLALVWILLSRKRASATDFQESILLNTIDDEVPDTLNEADDIPSHTEETSFLSDFSPSDIDALQDETGEVDPLSEADVYIAYGRYQQAEELIRQAMDKEPERSALKYKLFEILYAVKDTDGFIRLVEETVGTEVETGDDESWGKVLSMGKMLLPDHPMFVGADEIDSDDDLFTLDEDLLDEELDENDFADLDATLTQADFDLDQDGSEAEAGVETDAAVMDDALLDSELLNLSNELNATDDGLDDTALDLDDTVTELEDLEFDTSLDDDSIGVALDELEGLDDQEEVGAQQADEEEPEDDLMLSLSDLEDESEKTVLSLHASSMELGDAEEGIPALELESTDEPSSVEQELLANELEETVIDFPEADAGKAEFELDDPLAELDEAEDIDAAEDMEVDISVDDDMQDEVKTKLDLARAYAEMGDKDGAVDILDEVLAEGDESQKMEAQQIKESIT